jgi:molecular chaperone HtpG
MAMYVDPLTLFREYVQNAADAIDEAFQHSVLTGQQEGHISVSFDQEQRRISVRDNGIGVRAGSVDRFLTSFGASKKRGGIARGFRGVGRLAGLGYCQVLRFRTKAAEDSKVAVVEWDCRRLRQILLDSKYEGDLQQVVNDVVTYNEVDAKGHPSHFFEVELEKVLRIRNDILLNPEVVTSYLRQTAPLPFPKDFRFGKEIEAFLGPHAPPPRFRIYVGNSTEALTRPIGNTFPSSQGRQGQFQELELLRFESQDGQLAGLGWLLHHEYVGSLRYASEIRGLRARIGGILVGGADLFAHVFPEERFCSWTVGEINVVDRRIVPDGRRGDFEQNPFFFHLQNQIAPVGRAIAARCRASSFVRTRLKRFELVEKEAEELIAILRVGNLAHSTSRTMARDLEGSLEALSKIAELEAIPIQQKLHLGRRVARLRKKQSALRDQKGGSGVLKNIPRSKRDTFVEAFELIYECSRNRSVAKALIEKITTRLRATYSG